LIQKINSVTDIIDKFAKANLSVGAATEIAGDRGGTALLALISKAKRLRVLDKAFQNAAGEAKKMAKVMEDDLLGSLRKTLSAFESMIIGAGEAGLTKVLRDLLGVFTSAFLGIKKFNEESPGLLKFIGVATGAFIAWKPAILAWSGVIGIAKGLALAWRVAIIAVAGAVRAATAAQVLFNLATKANPLVFVIAGLITTIALAKTFNEEIVQATNALLKFFGIKDPEAEAEKTTNKVAKIIEEQRKFIDASKTLVKIKPFQITDQAPLDFAKNALGIPTPALPPPQTVTQINAQEAGAAKVDVNFNNLPQNTQINAQSKNMPNFNVGVNTP